MKLSALQKYILKQVFSSKSDKIHRGGLLKFYGIDKKTKQRDKVNIITKSLERLINHELMTGYGIRTSHKWFIKEVKLTEKGKKIAKTLFGKQQILPLKNKKKYKI
ncbi:hypothetical protein KKA15_04760 [Patescibacteria group bacterium]|nr:hypothetical protein [Patescibacteria group bacterium]